MHLDDEVKLVTIPLLPLRGVIVFPYTVIHLDVGRRKSVHAIDNAMLGDKKVFLATQKDPMLEDPGMEDLHSVGTIAEVKQILKMPGGTLRVLVEGLSRGNIRGIMPKSLFTAVSVQEHICSDAPKTPEEEALIRTLLHKFEQYARSSKRLPREIADSIQAIEDPSRLADIMTSHLGLTVEEKQIILNTLNIPERLNVLCEFLAKEMEVLELERKINSRVRKQMEKSQKDYYLREQLKAIQKELGDKEDNVSEIEDLYKQMEQAGLPEEVEDKLKKEIERLSHMQPMSAEAVVVRNYLDWTLSLPWSVETEDRLDLKLAEDILDKDHYGLLKPKERILEYLAIRKLAKELKGPILCFVGPPGVGKTSLGKSIAEALERKFVRMSLGGVRDEAEIRGHRRTYVGSMPGRILQRMKQAGSKNPVFLLDEIDKMASDFRGDPASAMLEVLDPEQNINFNDHYLETSFDLSKVLFITTANSVHSIPRPLLDRLEVIELSGYTEEEKLQIALKHLVPRELKEHGLEPENLTFSEGALRRIIRSYTKEAGVRGLQRQIGTVCRKVTRLVVNESTYQAEVNANQIGRFLGKERFRYGAAEPESQVGITTGLAWTESGGDILTIEAALTSGKGKLILTGKLGEVMKESAQTAFTYMKSRAAELKIDQELLDKTDVHIHVPEGAIPKDGPSAGITMTTSLISAYTGRKVKNTLAMTGEITLRGRVLPIGGLKEKVLAAHRAGVLTIVLPEANRKDMEEIPANIKRKMKFHLVTNMDEVLELALESG